MSTPIGRNVLSLIGLQPLIAKKIRLPSAQRILSGCDSVAGMDAMSAITRRALRVYAALEELKGQNGDVIDALIPFFEPILGLMNEKVFDPSVFSLGVKKMYGWRLTTDVAEQIAPRLEKRGYLRKEARTKRGSVFIVTYNEGLTVNTETDIVSFDNVIKEFKSFAPRVTDLLHYDKTADELADVLIRFLVSMDSVGEGLYSAALGGRTIPEETRKILGELEEGGAPLGQEDKYICAKFVHYIMNKKKELAPTLVRLSSIALLTEVVDDFVKPIQIEGVVNLTVALDAPLALDYLGCSGKALREDVVTVVEALKKIGVNFVVFSHSCIEMKHNLEAMLNEEPRDRFGYTHSAIVRNEIGIDWVKAVASDPERALTSAGLTVRSITLDSIPGAHRYFTKDRHDDFLSQITWGGDYLRKRTRCDLHDNYVTIEGHIAQL